MRGGLAHGTTLNELVAKVNTPYFSILDADVTWLKKDWDEILINKMTDKIKVIGTQAPQNKPQDFPLMFAILFETEIFKKLNIDFRPQDIQDRQDTGFEIREKYLKAGYQGLNIEMKSTRKYKAGPFANMICAKYYLQGYDVVFVSHFGRGSTLGAAKYKYKKFWKRHLYAVPLIGFFLLRKKSLIEKKKWIYTCKKSILKDCVLEKNYYEELKSCPSYCNSIKIKKCIRLLTGILINQVCFIYKNV